MLPNREYYFLCLLYLSLARFVCLHACMYVCVWHTECVCVTLWIYIVYVNELALVNKRLLENRFNMYAVAVVVAIVSNKVYLVSFTIERSINVCQNRSINAHTHTRTRLAFKITRFRPFCPFCHIVEPNYSIPTVFISYRAHTHSHTHIQINIYWNDLKANYAGDAHLLQRNHNLTWSTWYTLRLN